MNQIHRLTLILVAVCVLSICLWMSISFDDFKPEALLYPAFWFAVAYLASPIISLPIMALLVKSQIRTLLMISFTLVVTSAYWILFPKHLLPTYELAFLVLPLVLWAVAAKMTSIAIVINYLVKQGLKGFRSTMALLFLSVITADLLYSLAFSIWNLDIVGVGSFVVLSASLVFFHVDSVSKGSQPTVSGDINKST